ncbi:MAG: HPF/RaiA family ribosome-associated protein [Vulcanimicrobiota bacterium]
MQFELNTDNHVNGSQALNRHVGRLVESKLGRFGDRVTRVEVQLGAEDGSPKSRLTRCVMEARLAGFEAIAVTHQAESVDQALRGAADKLERTLGRTMGRLQYVKGRTPPYSGFSTDDRVEDEPNAADQV